MEPASTQRRIKECGNLSERKSAFRIDCNIERITIGKKKSWLANTASQLSGFYALRQLSTDSTYDDGGGDNSDVRWTSSMTAQSNSCTDKFGSIHMDNSYTRTGNSHIGNPDIRILFRLPQHQL